MGEKHKQHDNVESKFVDCNRICNCNCNSNCNCNCNYCNTLSQDFMLWYFKDEGPFNWTNTRSFAELTQIIENITCI